MIYFTVMIHSYFMGDWWCMTRSDSVSLFGAVDSFEALKFFIMNNSFTKADRFDWFIQTVWVYLVRLIRSYLIDNSASLAHSTWLNHFISLSHLPYSDWFKCPDSFPPVDWFFTTDSFLHPNGFVLFDLVYSLQKVLFTWLILVNMINSHTVILS